MQHIVDNNGVSLSWQAVGQGPTLLFVPGAGDAQCTWDEVCEALSGRFKCVTMDLRGQGDSARAPGTYRIENFASDVVAVLDEIGEQTVVVGHSLGAITAFQVAAQGHGLLRGVFLEDPPLFLGVPKEFNATAFPRAFRYMRREFGALQAAGATVEAFAAAMGDLPSLDGRRVRDGQSPRAIQAAGSSLARWDLSMLDVALDGTLWHGLDPTATLLCAVAVLQSDPELGAAFRPADRVRFLHHNPDAKVVLLEGADHSIHAAVSFQPRFLDELAAFVTGLP